MPAKLVNDIIAAYNAGATAAAVTAQHRAAVTTHIHTHGVVKGLQGGESPEGHGAIDGQLNRDWNAWTEAEAPFKPPAGATVYAPQISLINDDWATVHLELLYDGQPHIGTASLRKRGNNWKISIAHLEEK